MYSVSSMWPLNPKARPAIAAAGLRHLHLAWVPSHTTTTLRASRWAPGLHLQRVSSSLQPGTTQAPLVSAVPLGGSHPTLHSAQALPRGRAHVCPAGPSVLLTGATASCPLHDGKCQPRHRCTCCHECRSSSQSREPSVPAPRWPAFYPASGPARLTVPGSVPLMPRLHTTLPCHTDNLGLTAALPGDAEGHGTLGRPIFFVQPPSHHNKLQGSMEGWELLPPAVQKPGWH